MGIFSQDTTKTTQTSYNQQVGVSNRDLSGSQVTGAAGANTGGFLAVGPGSNANVTVNSLDANALNTAAFTVNHALDVNAAFAQSTLQQFQNADGIATEHTGGAINGLPPPVTTNDQGGATLAKLLPIHIDTTVAIAAIVIGGFLAYAYFKHRR